MFTHELCVLLMERTKTGSKYAAAQSMNITPQLFHKWYSYQTTMGNDYSLRAAKLLGLDPSIVLMGLFIERSLRVGEDYEVRQAVRHHWSHESIEKLPHNLQIALLALTDEKANETLIQDRARSLSAMSSSTID